LSLTTTWRRAAAGSQYRLAASAFDQHIAHLIARVAYLKDRTDFDGIDFSTTCGWQLTRLGRQSAPSSSSSR